jgi:hypothetical protein
MQSIDTKGYKKIDCQAPHLTPAWLESVKRAIAKETLQVPLIAGFTPRAPLIMDAFRSAKNNSKRKIRIHEMKKSGNWNNCLWRRLCSSALPPVLCSDACWCVVMATASLRTNEGWDATSQISFTCGDLHTVSLASASTKVWMAVADPNCASHTVRITFHEIMKLPSMLITELKMGLVNSNDEFPL